MPSEIGSWRRHENSVRFVGSRPREEGPLNPFSVGADTSKHYAVREHLCRGAQQMSATGERQDEAPAQARHEFQDLRSGRIAP
jgi:hypothetical protein